MYLLNKLALPINSNPGMIFPKEDFQDDDAQLKFTARLISGIMDYKIFIDEYDIFESDLKILKTGFLSIIFSFNNSKELPVDRLSCREKGQPLCMEQYYRLFTSYRAPGVEKDNLTDSSASMMLEPEHIIVISRNQVIFFFF
jgi:choline O-acetyltransferase